MNGETKPIKGFAVINFPTDLLVTLLSNGEVVTQTIPDYIYNKLFTANMYTNDEYTENDQVNDSDSVSSNKYINYKSSFKIFLFCFKNIGTHNKKRVIIIMLLEPF